MVEVISNAILPGSAPGGFAGERLGIPPRRKPAPSSYQERDGGRERERERSPSPGPYRGGGGGGGDRGGGESNHLVLWLVASHIFTLLLLVASRRLRIRRGIRWWRRWRWWTTALLNYRA